MVLIVKSRRTEIDQVDLRSEQHSTKLGTPRSQRARGRDIPVVRERLVCVVQQQDIFGLEIGVYQVQVVQESYRA